MKTRNEFDTGFGAEAQLIAIFVLHSDLLRPGAGT
jgi:hypothetical protein